ncbi:MAG: DUF2059 domain-containing protein [Burkholderiales bacterium]|nr:DUF2059 domain-containing protein [Burkholderiales bacterium]
MFRNSVLAAIIPAFALSVATVSAQPPQATSEAHQIAAEVVEISMGDSLLQGVRGNIGQMMAGLPKQMGWGDKLNTKQRAIMERFMRETLDEALSPEVMGSLRTAYVNAFATVYTLDELRGIRDFYRSPVGAAMVRKTPEAMTAAMPHLQSVMSGSMKRIQERAAKLAEEMKAAQ